MNAMSQHHSRPNEAGESPLVRDPKIPPVGLSGTLHVPIGARAVVLFAHGSGSSRFSPRNQAVADALNKRRIGTLLFDLLTPREETDRANVFDIALLAQRLEDAVRFLEQETAASGLTLRIFRRQHRRGGGVVVMAVVVC